MQFMDKQRQPIFKGDKFVNPGTTDIYQVIGFKEDGRLRAQIALLDFGGNPNSYGSTLALTGPIYLFYPHQILINKQWTK